MKILSKKAHNLLSKQKPRRRKKKRPLWQRQALLLNLALVGLGFAAWRLPWAALGEHASTLLYPEPASPWQIIVTASESNPLKDEERSSIIASVSRSVKRGSPQELAAAASKVLKDSPYDEVHIVKASPASLYISVQKREPSLLVFADKLRFLSRQGAVYGLVGEAQEGQGLASLDGVFSERRDPYAFNANNSLTLTSEEQLILQEALLLQTKLQDEHLNLASLTYKKYRGFFAVLADPETEIAFGRAPFTDKMKKLKKVLTHLAGKGVYAVKIELDYEGKVFIKEKSI